MILLHYMATLPSSTWNLWCHGMARGDGNTPIYRTLWLTWSCHVSIFYTLLWKKYLYNFLHAYRTIQISSFWSIPHFTMKHDKYGSCILCNLLEASHKHALSFSSSLFIHDQKQSNLIDRPFYLVVKWVKKCVCCEIANICKSYLNVLYSTWWSHTYIQVPQCTQYTSTNDNNII